MKEPTNDQKLVSIPTLCQLLVEFIEDTYSNGSPYARKLKHHAKGLVEASDEFLSAVYGYAKTVDHANTMADEQNQLYLEIKNGIAEGVIIE